MFCRDCGKMVQDGNKFCTGCGSKIIPIRTNTNSNVQNNKINTTNVRYNTNPNISNSKDRYSVGFNILSFFIPIVGLILFLVWKKEMPKKAKGIGISALVGYIISIVTSILYLMFVFWLAFTIPSNDMRENIREDIQYYDDDYDKKYDFEADYEFNGRYNI